MASIFAAAVALCFMAPAAALRPALHRVRGGRLSAAAVHDVSSMDELAERVEGAAPGQLVLVKAYGANCPKCKRMVPLYASFAESHEDVDCLSVNLSGVSGAYAALGAPASVPAFVAYADGERLEDLGSHEGVEAIDAYATAWAEDACDDECDVDFF